MKEANRRQCAGVYIVLGGEAMCRALHRVGVLWIVLAFFLPALADGIIIPIPGPEIPGPPLRWLTIVYHHVTVTIQDGVATTQVDQAFRNDGRFPVEGTYVFPLPQGAVIQKFSLWVNGEPVQGEVLPAEEARRIYLEYLRQARDPALLEYVGEGAFRARVFPIAPGETRRIALEYVELLSAEGGLFRYRYPLAPERFSARPLEVGITTGFILATPENMQNALRATSALGARGMTNIREALLKSME